MFQEQGMGAGSDIADPGGVAEGEGAIGPGGNEFLGDVAGVAEIEEGAEDGGVVDLLGGVEFGAAGDAGGVDMADEVPKLAHPADDIAVHDLDVVDVEEEFHPGRIDAADEIGATIDIVPEVSRVSFHGVGIVAAVEMFEAEIDAGGLGVGDDLLPGLDAMAGAGVVGDAGFPHAGERDHPRAANLDGEIDGFAKTGHNVFPVGGVEGAAGEAVTADEGDFEAEVADLRIVAGVDAFHGDEADVAAEAGEFEGGHGIIGPAHDGLADAPMPDAEGGIHGVLRSRSWPRFGGAGWGGGAGDGGGGGGGVGKPGAAGEGGSRIGHG